MCDCLTKANEILAEHNAQVDLELLRAGVKDGKGFLTIRPMVVLKKRNKKKILEEALTIRTVLSAVR